MSDKFLTRLVCGILPIILIIVVAIFSMINKIKWSKKLHNVIKNKSENEILTQQEIKKIKVFSYIGVFSVLGIIITIIILIVMNNLLEFLLYYLGLLIYFFIIFVISGTIIFEVWNKKTKG